MANAHENGLGGVSVKAANETSHIHDSTPATELQGDTAAALAFLKGHCAGWPDTWYLQFIAIEPKRDKDHKPGIEALSVPPSRIGKLKPWIDSHQGRWGIYFGVNPLRNSIEKKATKADIAALAYLHTDNDPSKTAPLAEERVRLQADVAAFPVKPSELIDSGNGLGVFWRLQEPIPVEGNAEELEAVSKRLARHFGGDACHNIERVMRLPGTINVPDYRKRERGCVRVPARLLDQNQAAYRLEDFDFLPPVEAKPARGSRADLASVNEAALAARLQVVRVDPELAALLRGEPLHWMKDTSSSGFDFALAHVLIRLGFSDGEIAVTVAGYPYGKTERHNDVAYLTHTIGNAHKALPDHVATTPGIPVAHNLCTDLANANRLHRAAGANILFAAGQWLVFDGAHWSADEAAAYRQTCCLSALIRAEAGEWDAKPTASAEEAKRNREIAEALRKWAAKSEMKHHLDAAFHILRRLVEVPADKLDCDPYLLNVANGTIDLHTGQLHPHDKFDYITKLIPIPFDPQATAPLFEKALAEITGEAGFQLKPLASFLQRWFGCCATGVTSEQKLVVHWGDCGNGKSLLLGAIERVLGPYAGTAAPNLLVGGPHDRHPTELADMRGKRMVTAAESGDDGMLREEFVKRATGGDRIKARFMRQDFFEFAPTHKLQLLTNHKPQIRGQDHAIWRRVLLVPYEVTFGTAAQVAQGEAHHVRDDALSERLKAEDAGILAWLVQGAVKWHLTGLRPPDIVLAAGAAYREEQDRVGQFIAECCSRHSGEKVRLKELFPVYQRWAKDCGFLPLGRSRFADAVGKRPGITAKGTEHGKIFTGLKLTYGF